MVLAIIVLIAGLCLLAFSANHLINTSVRIAKHFHVSDLLIGLTILAIGTSAPELFLSGMAALQGSGSLSIGNIIGSNIFNLGIILGISAIAVPVLIQKKLVRRDGTFLLVITALIFWMLWDQHVTLWEGAILLALLVGYNAYLFVKKESPTDESIDASVPKIKNFVYLFLGVILLAFLDIDTANGFQISFAMNGFSEIFVAILLLLFIIVVFRRQIPGAKSTSKGMLLNITKLVASIGLLILSADAIVDAAVFIAQTLGMSQWAIGATIIAAGTSLPELATTVSAILKKKYDMGVANLVGSNIFNTLGIIGVSAVIRPIDLTPVCLLPSGNCEGRAHFFQDTSFSFLLLFLTMGLIVFCMRKDWKISRREGRILLIVSIIVLAFEASPTFFFGLLG